MFKLYTDKNEIFECAIDIKNASLTNSNARLVIEGKDMSIIFEGKIQAGKCTIPIKKLKGILDENASGKLRLEVIVEDMFFKPWESEYVVETHNKVYIKVNEQKEPIKPTVSVLVEQQKPSTIQEIKTLLYSKGINKKNINKKINESRKIINTYFIKTTSITQEMKKEILRETISSL